ncbi:MAG: hypothetical protein ACP5H8_00690 [Candidatus Micrarchaeia archaeon]
MDYISTDVDRIIDYIKNRKRAELIEVARALNIKAVDVDKWAKVLEKQGVVNIEYTLTRMYIIWKSPDSVEESAQAYEYLDVDRSEIDKPEQKSSKKHVPKQVQPSKHSMQTPKHVHKKTVSTNDSLIKSILHIPRVSAQSKDVQRPDHARTDGQINEPQEAVEPAASRLKKPSPEPNINLDNANRLSMLLKNKVDAINQTVAEIAELKAEKERLYEKEYIPLISRFDNQVSTLSEKLAEREAAILSLRKKAVELPDAVARVEVELQNTSKSLSKVMDEYSKNIESISHIQEELSKIRENVRTELAFSKNSIKSCIDSVSEVERSISSINALKEQAMKRVEEARTKIDEEYKVIEKMAALIDGIDIQVKELTDDLENISKSIEDGKKKVEQLQMYESTLGNSEKAIEALKSAYSEKRKELLKAAREQEAELDKLRLDIEKGFLRKYLTELKKLSEEHDQEASAILKRDDELELRLRTARERLQQLLKESRELNKKFEDSI